MELNSREKSILESAIEGKLRFFYDYYLEKLCKASDDYFKENFNELYELRKKLQKEKIISDSESDVDEMYKQINS